MKYYIKWTINIFTETLEVSNYKHEDKTKTVGYIGQITVKYIKTFRPVHRPNFVVNCT